MSAKQYLGASIIGTEAIILKNRNDLMVKYDNIFHFLAGIGLGMITRNPLVHVTAILGWEIVEPYVYLYLKKYPGVSTTTAGDTFKDILVTSIGVYTSTKYLNPAQNGEHTVK